MSWQFAGWPAWTRLEPGVRVIIKPRCSTGLRWNIPCWMAYLNDAINSEPVIFPSVQRLEDFWSQSGIV